MAVDYDLVIIGSSWAGIYAAKNAVQLQARVALVTQSDRHYLPNDALLSHSLSEIARFKERLADNPFGLSQPNNATSLTTSDWLKETYWQLEGSNSLAHLAALGIDVIVGKGKFYSQPKLGFQVNRRSLRSRNFILAVGASCSPPFSDKNQAGAYLTLRDLEHRDIESLPQSIIIIGGEPIALELAQTLASFNKQVTLVVESSRILPHEDLDIAILVQAQLEATGIKIVTGFISQVRLTSEQKRLKAGDLVLTADEVIIVGYRQPNIAALNIEAVDVKCDRRKVLVNQKLQTTNPYIYACGDLIGGYSLPNVAQHEVSLILKNTLWFPWYKVNYNYVPWSISIRPSLTRIGLNETQARQQYGDDIYVVKQNLNQVTQAQILEQTSGVCKLIVRDNGEILGCSLVSDRGGELISIIALMMQHKIRLQRNPMKGLTSVSIPAVYPSMVEILQQASNNFYRQKLERRPLLLARLRTWFSKRKG